MFDIPKEQNINKKIKTSILFIFLTVVMFFFYRGFSSPSYNKEKYESGVVSLAEFQVSINTYGKLRAKLRRGVIARSSGHISDIYLRPGAVVSVGSKIIQLSNPKLERQRRDSQLLFLEEKANLEKLSAELAQSYAQQEANIELSQAQLTLSAVDLKANQKLRDNNVISALKLEKVRMVFLRDGTILDVEKKKIVSLAKSQKAAITSAKYSMQRAEAKVSALDSDIKNLSLNSSMNGVLMTLEKTLEIGQYVTEGQYIGTIVDNKDLYAELVVSASDANRLRLKQTVEIIIKGKHVTGYITRIAPTVVNGSVEIDVEFKEPLPNSALPNIDIIGKVTVVNLTNAFVSKRPSGVNTSHKQYQLFVMKNNSDYFQKVLVNIGEINKNNMQILSPVSEGDMILVAIPEKFKHSIKIYLADLNE